MFQVDNNSLTITAELKNVLIFAAIIIFILIRVTFFIDKEEKYLNLPFYSMYHMGGNFKKYIFYLMILFGYLVYIPFIKNIVRDRLIYKNNKTTWRDRYNNGNGLKNDEYFMLLRYFKLRELKKKSNKIFKFNRPKINE